MSSYTRHSQGTKSQRNSKDSEGKHIPHNNPVDVCHLILIKTELETEQEGGIPVKGHRSGFNSQESGVQSGFEYE